MGAPVGEPEYILSEDKYDNILKMATQYDIMKRRLELLNQQVSLLSQKSILVDSAQTIRTLEAKFWYDKLHQTDKLLEEERIRAANVWNSKTFWFMVGALTATVVYLTRIFYFYLSLDLILYNYYLLIILLYS